jgi:hypothetical protein
MSDASDVGTRSARPPMTTQQTETSESGRTIPSTGPHDLGCGPHTSPGSVQDRTAFTPNASGAVATPNHGHGAHQSSNLKPQARMTRQINPTGSKENFSR